MASPVMLAIDVVLGALIGPRGTAAEMIIDHARFARLMRHAQLAASSIRNPGTAFSPPSLAEIEHWRDVVFGRSLVDDTAVD